ncbi:Extracellular sulfatase SULF-1 [Seminavis robusta]|uniref:Extracellular sulfatase SULF-1 n=1 Tax=Seminavis robusta TaxID=568900 RepID=A0A9N8E511_9STRA|nr:Extracellular sulfatase SULF-1 [Seminavis robusta]|eukprot:Sro658_g182740.1 Extracellular sulfatase SULF-1 (498) ;mRNA; r:28383-30632
MDRFSYKVWVPITVVIAITLSMHHRSYDAVTGAVEQLMNQDIFAPTRMDDSALPSSHEPNKIDKPLNVVVMYGDDWRHDAIGVAGTLPVETPFIDWLSRNKGMRFTHNCVTSSICWISRATLHSGKYFSRHKAEEPASEDWYKDFHQAFPALLKNAGYYVAHIGKWHTWNSGIIQKYYHHWQEYYGRHWYPGNPHPIHATTRNQEDAVAFLKDRPKKFADKPFFLLTAFFAPHSWDGNPEQFLPQNETFHVYKNLTLKEPYDMASSFKRLPPLFTERNEARNRWRHRFDEPTKYDKMLKNYFRLITGVDTACKAVWDELDRQGILNETIFIFTTDNGFYHGEHGLAGKWYPHEESIRVPLVIWDPRMPDSLRGTTDDSFTLNVDLAPTILGAANITPPKVMQGRDISDLYLRPHSPPWRKEFFYEHPVHLHKEIIPASTALVRKELKYIDWPGWDTEQLFNLTNDPLEQTDEINNPIYANILKEMRARHSVLREWVK